MIRPFASLALVGIGRLSTLERRRSLTRRSISIQGALALGMALAMFRLSGGDIGGWQLILSLWSSFAMTAALTTVRTTLSAPDRWLYAMTPMTITDRWRAAFVRVGFGLSPVWLLSLAIAGIILARDGWPWPVVAIIGMPTAGGLGVVAAVCIASLLRGQHRRRWLLVLIAAFPASLLMITLGPWTIPSPLLLVPDQLVWPAIGAFAVAGMGGRWLDGLAYDLNAYRQGGRSWLPLHRWLSNRIMRRCPSATSAMLHVTVSRMNRDPFALLVLIGPVVIFPLMMAVDSRLPALLPADAPFLAGAIFVAWCLTEIVPSPLGTHGRRLTLALLADASPRACLLGAWLGTSLVVLPPTAVLVGATAWWNRPGQLLTVSTLLFAIAIVDVLALSSALSAFDLDPGNLPDDAISSLVLEHLPLGAARLTGLAVALGSMAVTTTAIIAGTCLASLMAVAALTAITLGAWRLAERRLGRPFVTSHRA